MKKSVKLPNFLIVGVQKAGTTSIYNYLKQHPQVYMSPVKETGFLEKDWQKTESERQIKNPKGIYTFERYCQLFADVQDEIAIGEASPNYLFHYETSAPLIQKYVPNAKLIAILRNPSERAYSDYLMHIRDGIRYKKNLDNNICYNFLEQIQHRSHKSFIIRKGFYYTPIQHYLKVFGKELFKVFLYDELCQNPVKFVQNLYEFIGVDRNFIPDVSVKAQVAKVPKNESFNKILQTQNPIRSSVANILKLFLPLETRQNIRSLLIEANSNSKEKIGFPAQERQNLIKLYQQDILKLQDLIQQDLSAWLKA